MVTTANIAELGALVGDPGRAAMLTALLDGRARTARELADCAGIAAQTASGHLARLLAAEMLTVERQGRHRYHRLASVEVAQMLEAMHLAAAAGRAPARRLGPADSELRFARSCYDHLAGRLGVALADVLGADADATLSAEAERGLAALGLDLAAARSGKRPFCRPCLDWSERRPHLAGALGAALLDRLLALDWLRRRAGSRALTLTPAGQAGLQKRFGIRLE